MNNYIKNILNEDNNGFNKLHSTIAYTTGTLQAFNQIISNEALVEYKEGRVKVITSLPNNNQLKLTPLEMFLKLDKGYKYFEALLQSDFFNSLSTEEYYEFLNSSRDNVFQYCVLNNKIALLERLLQDKRWQDMDNVDKHKLLTGENGLSIILICLFNNEHIFKKLWNLLGHEYKDFFLDKHKLAKDLISATLTNPKYFKMVVADTKPEIVAKLLSASYEGTLNLLDLNLRMQKHSVGTTKIIVDQINKLSATQIKNIFFKGDSNNALFTAILGKSTTLEEAEYIFNSPALAKLSAEEKAELLAKDGEKSVLVQLIYAQGQQMFKKVWSNLEQKDQIAILEKNKELVTVAGLYDLVSLTLEGLPNEALMNIIYKAYSFGNNLLSHFLNVKNLPRAAIKELLGVMKELPSSDIFKVLNTPERGGELSTIGLAIRLANNIQKAKYVLESQAFNKLSYEEKISILSYGSIFEYSLGNKKLLDILLGLKDPAINKQFMTSLNESVWLTGTERLDEIAQILNQYPHLKNLTDRNGFSLAYYLMQHHPKSIAKYKDLVIKTPNNISVEECGNYIHYKAVDAKRNIIMLSAEDEAKEPAFNTPIIHSFLLKGYNVIHIDARAQAIPTAKIYEIVKKFKQVDTLYLRIHGSIYNTDEGSSKLLGSFLVDKNTKGELNAVNGRYELGSIEVRELLKGFASALDNKPLNIILTSCYGQIITSEIEGILPEGSTLITSSEYQEINGKLENHKYSNCREMKLSQQLEKISSLNAENFTMGKFLTYIANTAIGNNFSSPAITIVKDGVVHTQSILTLMNNHADKISVHNDITGYLCDEEDKLRIDEINTYVNNFEPKDYAIEQLLELRKKDAESYSIKMGILSAAYFTQCEKEAAHQNMIYCQAELHKELSGYDS